MKSLAAGAAAWILFVLVSAEASYGPLRGTPAGGVATTSPFWAGPAFWLLSAFVFAGGFVWAYRRGRR